MSKFNFGTIAAFLNWFGGAGNILTNWSRIGIALVLLTLLPLIFFGKRSCSLTLLPIIFSVELFGLPQLAVLPKRPNQYDDNYGVDSQNQRLLPPSAR